MNNPYHILNIAQDSSKADIHNAQKRAMASIKQTGFRLADIQNAARQLLDPAKRLAADFMLPTKIKAKRPQKIIVELVPQEVETHNLDTNAFDSLK